jgi:hypothetical protein
VNLRDRCLGCGEWLKDSPSERVDQKTYWPHGRSGRPHKKVRYTCPRCGAPQTRLVFDAEAIGVHIGTAPTRRRRR